MLKHFKKILMYILILGIFLLISTFLYTKTSHYKNLEAQKYINCGVAGCDNVNNNINIEPASQADIYPKTEVVNEILVGKEQNTKPKIYSLDKTSYKYGDTVEVRGENFYALENDKIVIIENGKGEKIYLDTIWNQWHSYISFVLPSEVCSVLEGESGIADCKDRNGKMIKIEKGAYKLYYPDFGTGELSNSVNFSIE